MTHIFQDKMNIHSIETTCKLSFQQPIFFMKSMNIHTNSHEIQLIVYKEQDGMISNPSTFIARHLHPEIHIHIL